jgi:O-antigen ligase
VTDGTGAATEDRRTIGPAQYLQFRLTPLSPTGRKRFWGSGRPNRPLPRVTALLFLILGITPELKFRVRDAAEAFTGSLDAQILFELFVYALVAVWIAWYLTRGTAARRYRLSAMNLPMGALLFVMVVILVSAAHALSVRSAIRALQFVEFVGMTLLVFWEARDDPRFLPEFWIWLRRGFVAFAVVATLVTATNPAWGALLDDDGVSRYAWFEIHPIVTAGMLGIAMVMLGSMYLGLGDPLLRRVPWRLATGGLIGVFAILLVETRSRGALVAALSAVVALVVLSPRRERRRPAALAVLAAAAAVLVFVLVAGSDLFRDWALRGQTVEQVQSLSQRTQLFELGKDLIAEEPVWGQGYLMAGPRFRTFYSWAGHAHNVLLEVLVSMGYVGLFAFVFLLLVVLGRLWRGTRSPPVRRSGFPLEAAAILLLLLVQGVISDGFGGSVGFEVAGLLLVVLIAAAGDRAAVAGADPGTPPDVRRSSPVSDVR